MQVQLKLFASLSRFLPREAVRNVASLEIPADVSIQGLLDQHNVPPEHCHLVMLNGVYKAPEDRPNVVLTEGDVVAVWPPVAGG